MADNYQPKPKLVELMRKKFRKANGNGVYGLRAWKASEVAKEVRAGSEFGQTYYNLFLRFYSEAELGKTFDRDESLKNIEDFVLERI